VSAAEPAVAQPRLRVVFGALLLVVLLAALDQTIVSTALPTIVGEFGGVEHLSWVVTAYLLGSTVVTPLYGKLGDLYGRKRLLQSAILIFLLGSALCGLSQNMPQLIAFRAIQGIGGGGLMVTAIASVGDIVPPSDRGRYQGMFGGVFGIATIIGPLAGGFIVEHLSWRWIFYVNIPLGAVAFAVVAIVLRSPAERRAHTIDYLGTVALAGALTSIVLFTSLGGTTLHWSSPAIILLAIAGAVGLVAFVAIERRAVEPLLPLSLFRNRVFSVASGIGLIVGLALFGSVTYMPLYLQIVKGKSPSDSGLLLLPLMAGVLVASIGSGQLISRMGRYRVFPIVGTALMTVALALLSRLEADTSIVVVGTYMLLLGLGLGLVMQVLVLAVQNSVDYANLGVATSGATLFRTVGGSLGVSLFGAIFANQLATNLFERVPPGASVPQATDPATIAALDPVLHTAYVEAFAASIRPVFLAAACISLFAFVLTWFLVELPLRRTVEAEGIGESFASPRSDESFHELVRSLSVLAKRENRWRAYASLAERAGVDVGPAAAWLLVRLGDRDGMSAEPARLAPPLAELRDCGFLVDGSELTPEGRDAHARLVAAREARLAELLEGWAPEQHAELEAAIADLARDLASEPPVAPATA
jgi:EmrB/QacA subfamily drug resistance transporter